MPPLSKGVLARLLRREAALRRSAETQRVYAQAELGGDTDWMEVTDALQRRVVREAGVPLMHESTALRQLRTAPRVHPDLAHLAIHYKYQRVRMGDLREGDVVPDVALATLDGAATSLHALLHPQRPTVLLAGSHS